MGEVLEKLVVHELQTSGMGNHDNPVSVIHPSTVTLLTSRN